jgi:hypothetical protein
MIGAFSDVSDGETIGATEVYGKLLSFCRGASRSAGGEEAEESGEE